MREKKTFKNIYTQCDACLLADEEGIYDDADAKYTRINDGPKPCGINNFFCKLF